MLYTIIYFQGISALRLVSENENLHHVRGESSCILPIPNRVHQQPKGSRLAIKHLRVSGKVSG